MRHRWWIGSAVLVAGAALAVGIVVTGVSRANLEAPPPTVLLLDRHGRFLGETGGDDATGFGYWPLAEVPERVAAATIAIEDRRFATHLGVDPRAVVRAAWQNLRAGRHVSGASTLAMQVARMQRPGHRTYLRKVVEACTALALTRRVGRDALLRHYLTVVPYANQTHGIAYAARRYLDKPVEDLSWAEVAFLAAIPQSPARMNPFDAFGRSRAIGRGREVLRRLHAGGVLDDAEHRLAQRQIGAIRVPPRAVRPDPALHAVLALEQLVAGARRGDLRSGQPVVTTTLDLGLQRTVHGVVAAALEEWEPRGVGNLAAVVLDPHSREVLAWVGSAGYFDQHHSGAIDYVRVARSPGSTLKPFLYARALDLGVIDPATVLDDLARGAGEVGNADERFLGPLLPRSALATSRNVPAVELLHRLGLEQGATFLADLGLHDGDAPARHYGLGLAIGGLPTTLERLARAYTVLAGDGRLGELVWYRGQGVAPSRRVVSEGAARQITLFLADPMARLPAFPRMGHLEYPFPVAVKTGTSSGYHDAWTVAYSTRYLVAVWAGHPGFSSMNRVTGYACAARLAQRLMLRLHPDRLDGLSDLSFPPPRGSRPLPLCAATGRLATAACDRVAVEYFPPGRGPVDRCAAHLRLAVDDRSGALASAATPPAAVRLRTFTRLGPRYAEWQATHGIPFPPGTVGVAGRLPSPLRPARLRITSPRSGLRLLRDPETPPEFATLALSVVVDPPREQVLWVVDGSPFQLVSYPFSARWPLTEGEHLFEARLPFEPGRSEAVRVTVE